MQTDHYIQGPTTVRGARERIMWGISEPKKLALCSKGREGERTAEHYKELTKRTHTTEYTGEPNGAWWNTRNSLGGKMMTTRRKGPAARGAGQGSVRHARRQNKASRDGIQSRGIDAQYVA